VLRTFGEPLSIEEVVLASPAPDQVRVRIVASGVCRSDMLMQDGTRPHPTPVVLGHEGAGVVEEVGRDVVHVRPGDHVVLVNCPPCRRCWHCLRAEPYLCEQTTEDTLSMPYATSLGGERLLPVMGVATFATSTVTLGRAVVPIDRSIPLDVAALVGCAVTTGFCAAVRTGGVTPGSTALVIGCGGVGLSAVLGAAHAGAERVIAADPVPGRRALAIALGATHAVDPSGNDLVAAVLELTGGRGADYSFEAVGRSQTIQAAWRATRRGGTIVVIGASSLDDLVTLPAFQLFDDAKRLIGCQSGSADPERDFPLILDLWQRDRLPFDRLITRRIALDEVNDGFADLRTGVGVRTVIVNETPSSAL